MYSYIHTACNGWSGRFQSPDLEFEDLKNQYELFHKLWDIPFLVDI